MRRNFIRWVLIALALSANETATDAAPGSYQLRTDNLVKADRGSRGTIVIASPSSKPRRLLFATHGTLGQGRFSAVVVRDDGRCATARTDRSGCGRLRVEMHGRRGRLVYFDFGRRRVVPVDLRHSSPTVLDGKAARSILFRSSASETALRLENRNFDRKLTVQFDLARQLGPLTPSLLAAIDLFDSALADITPTPRIASEGDGDVSKKTVVETDCGVCSFCEDLPGGNTLDGCFGEGYDGGDLGEVPGGTISHPGGSGSSGAGSSSGSGASGGGTCPSPPSCVVTDLQAGTVFGQLLDELSFNSCDPSFFRVEDDLKIFREELAKISTHDPASRKCAECFIGVTSRFSINKSFGVGSTIPTAEELKVIARELGSSCIRDIINLDDPCNESIRDLVAEHVDTYKQLLGNCKINCDASDAARRAYCACDSGYLDFVRSGPHPPPSSICPAP